MPAQHSEEPQKIVPNIWCNQNADEVAEFYARVFPNSTTANHQRYPTEGLLDFQRPMAGKTLTIDVLIDGFQISMINADDTFTPNPSVNFIINNTAGKKETDRLWEQLSEGGQTLMPLQEYPFNQYYGWVQDQFGVSWQLMTHDGNRCDLPYIYPQLMFSGAAQNRAGEAIDHYVQVFDQATLVDKHTYGDINPEAAESADAVAFALIELDGQTISLMDSGVDQPFTFSGGIALMVNVHGQEQLDRYWEQLSAVPEAEQCGWLTDRFGLSWEIVPDNLGELMAKDGAYEKLMQMKKIVIADF